MMVQQQTTVKNMDWKGVSMITEEELRMRCLELAYKLSDVNDSEDAIIAAEKLYQFAIKDRYPTQTQNKIHFEKVSQERKE